MKQILIKILINADACKNVICLSCTIQIDYLFEEFRLWAFNLYTGCLKTIFPTVGYSMKYFLTHSELPIKEI